MKTLLLLCLLPVFASALPLASLSSCSVCLVARQIAESAQVQREIVREASALCTQHFAADFFKCREFSRNFSLRLLAFGTKLNCEQSCAAELSCDDVRSLLKHANAFSEGVVADAASLCRGEQSCLKQTQAAVQNVQRIVQLAAAHALGRGSANADCALLKGTRAPPLRAGEDLPNLAVVRNEDDALPLECSLCNTLCEFFLDALNVGFINKIFDKILTTICKLIPSNSIDCTQLLDVVMFLLGSLCEVADNGGSSLCNLLDNNCPEPPS